MNSPDEQQSEVHESTADASTSPTAAGDEAATRQAGSSSQRSIHVPTDQMRVPEPMAAGTRIVSDETDSGGPLVIVSNDPELNPPHVPSDPFPTDGTPQIDPPIAR